MEYLNAFLCGGILCAIGQILIDRTTLTPARILTGYVVTGVALSALGLYEPLIRWGGAGATVPLTGFGHTLATGVEKAVAEQGWLGVFTGPLGAAAGGITAAVVFGAAAAFLFRPAASDRQRRRALGTPRLCRDLSPFCWFFRRKRWYTELQPFSTERIIVMRRWMCFFLAVCSLLTLCACGQTPPEQDPDSPEAAEEESQEPEAPPEPEPYSIYDPTVMPEGGSRDGVTYVAYDGIVEHLFFHPVVAYPELALSAMPNLTASSDYMVTADEYRKILQSVYDRGYVLVDIADVWSETTDESGNAKMVKNTLYLPEGKKPLILSFDDTNYYEYMLSNGFTWKLVIGEDGKIASYGKDPQGAEVISRDLDAIPILDKFVEEHRIFPPSVPRAA